VGFGHFDRASLGGFGFSSFSDARRSQRGGVIEKLGSSEGYSMIMERNGQTVLYVGSTIDITDKVVKKFDGAE
jgi:hypothetical protein